MNWLRKFFGLHVHEWGNIECIRMPTRHAHAQWCKTCGDYKMVYLVVCHQK